MLYGICIDIHFRRGLCGFIIGNFIRNSHKKKNVFFFYARIAKVMCTAVFVWLILGSKGCPDGSLVFVWTDSSTSSNGPHSSRGEMCWDTRTLFHMVRWRHAVIKARMVSVAQVRLVVLGRVLSCGEAVGIAAATLASIALSFTFLPPVAGQRTRRGGGPGIWEAAIGTVSPWCG
jgi:hypothetical protein